MYKFAYAEILDESATLSRERERLALDHAVDLLERATGAAAPERQAALLTLQKLWSFFIADLADGHNELPQALKADLASLGLWVIQEADRALNEQAHPLRGLIDVNRAIRDGLK
ncbi:flagellar biosynthesis regulator FlaF [Xanthobacter sp. ZOL 2024]